MNEDLQSLYQAHMQRTGDNWTPRYRERCEFLRTIDPKTFDWSDNGFLEAYWRERDNGIAGIGSGMLSHEEFENIRDELPTISKEIFLAPTAATLDSMMQWLEECKNAGKLKFTKKGVLRRFFCACDPDNLSTIVKTSDLKRFVRNWNRSGYGPRVELTDNWVTLNHNVMQAIRSSGLQKEDAYDVSTFAWRLAEYFNDPSISSLIRGASHTLNVQVNSRNQIGSRAPLNQILYGPPGTGKTYSTIEKAVAIIDPDWVASLDDDKEASARRKLIKSRYDEYVKSGQIAFTTFHQSFSYEDFVEGLKADSEDGQLNYFVEDGIFKTICQRADSDTQIYDLDAAITDLKTQCSEEPLRLTTATGKAFSVSYRGGKTFRCLPGASTEKRDLPANVQHVRKVALGETPDNLYCASYVRAIARHINSNYSLDSNSEAEQRDSAPHVLIIDEINRGNISRIFGELITLLEASKRKGESEQLSVTLPYSKETFTIPNNLYVIGTMNTADSSLAKVDIALRRRFSFEACLPNSNLLSELIVDGINVGRVLETINKRIEILFDRDHCIGHSYFMKLNKDSDVYDLAKIFGDSILPLLEEYFFDDWEMIHRVLGDHLKAHEELRFIIERFSNSELRSLLGDDWLNDVQTKNQWHLNQAALYMPEAYIGIYDNNLNTVDYVEETALDMA
ncbi:McrB family protein [Microbulbifer sediminum]|uniref:McrB family protein n=1 Tax=Microbulbifer sediminum TaxID=2904250 RepID=UPI001F01C708|nr:AAA family ATPase [Microbulbifer sediminum]